MVRCQRTIIFGLEAIVALWVDAHTSKVKVDRRTFKQCATGQLSWNHQVCPARQLEQLGESAGRGVGCMCFNANLCGLDMCISSILRMYILNLLTKQHP